MTQFTQLHPKVQQFLMALQDSLPINCHLTLDVNLSESWLHRYYIGVNGYQYELWHNCLDVPNETWGYALVGYRPF